MDKVQFFTPASVSDHHLVIKCDVDVFFLGVNFTSDAVPEDFEKALESFLTFVQRNNVKTFKSWRQANDPRAIMQHHVQNIEALMNELRSKHSYSPLATFLTPVASIKTQQALNGTLYLQVELVEGFTVPDKTQKGKIEPVPRVVHFSQGVFGQEKYVGAYEVLDGIVEGMSVVNAHVSFDPHNPPIAVWRRGENGKLRMVAFHTEHVTTPWEVKK